jgi:hypothetical protein
MMRKILINCQAPNWIDKKQTENIYLINKPILIPQVKENPGLLPARALI